MTFTNTPVDIVLVALIDQSVLVMLNKSHCATTLLTAFFMNVSNRHFLIQLSISSLKLGKKFLFKLSQIGINICNPGYQL